MKLRSALSKPIVWMPLVALLLIASSLFGVGLSVLGV